MERQSFLPRMQSSSTCVSTEIVQILMSEITQIWIGPVRFEKERREVLRACMDLLKSGLVRTLGAEGNVSLKTEKDEDLFAITPSQVRYDTMDPEDVLIVNTEGEIVDKITDYKPSSETPTPPLYTERWGNPKPWYTHILPTPLP